MRAGPRLGGAAEAEPPAEDSPVPGSAAVGVGPAFDSNWGMDLAPEVFLPALLLGAAREGRAPASMLRSGRGAMPRRLATRGTRRRRRIRSSRLSDVCTALSTR